MNSTGPLFLTKILKKYDEKNILNRYVLNQSEFAGDCNVCNETKCLGGTYFKHIEGNSWHSWDSTFYNAVLCNYKWILMVFIVFCGSGLIYRNKKGKVRVKVGQKLKY